VNGRSSSRFDPSPDLPPSVAIAIDWALTAGVATLGVAAVAGAVWVLERYAARRSTSEVLRGDG
jgi:hypothetical protein